MIEYIHTCDYCKEKIKEGDYNQIIDGIGTLLLKHEGGYYYLRTKLESPSEAFIRKEICKKCLFSMIEKGLEYVNG